MPQLTAFGYLLAFDPPPLQVTDTISEIFKDNRVLLEQLTEDVLHCFLNFEKNKQSTRWLCRP